MSDSKKDTNTKDITVQSDEKFRQVFRSFLRNDHHTFVVQKTEKLASGLYMVTGFIPEEDPLRTRLRVCALDLVSTCTDPDKARSIRYQDGFASRCLEIGTILKLAERAGFVSSMNAQILCDEYAELASFVSTHHDKIFGNMPIASGVEEALQKPVISSTTLPVTAHVPKTQKTSQPKKVLKGKRHSSRKEAILRLLDKKDKINIKDASAEIEGCSEKTIQRELISLVEEGVLLKEGERRWSTYRKA